MKKLAIMEYTFSSENKIVFEMRLLKMPLLMLFILFMFGCTKTDIPSPYIGPLQITQAGKTCSFFTSIFNGPLTARGRNEGYLKSTLETKRLFPIYNIPTILKQASMLKELNYYDYLNQETRCSLNLNKYEDVRQTIQIVEKRKLVSKSRANALRRHLVQSNFICTDTIIDAYDNTAISRDEARNLFFQWLFYMSDYSTINLYLHIGNRYMISRLVKRNIISSNEGIYFLSNWVANLERFHPVFLEDLENLGAINKQTLNLLIDRESCYFRKKFQIHGADHVLSDPKKKVEVCDNKTDVLFAQLRDKINDTIKKPTTFPKWFQK